MEKQIIEMALEIESAEEWHFLEALLSKISIDYYVKPQRKIPLTSLEELEKECEGG